MVNKSGLQAIGWCFGGTTAAVALIAALLVSQAVQTTPYAGAPGLRGIASDFSSASR